MSTRSTVWYDHENYPDWHLYMEGLELMDDGYKHIYVEFPREALIELDTIRIPLEIWKQIGAVHID